MRKNNFKKYLLVSLACVFFVSTMAQELHIGDGGAFYLGTNSDFATSNTLVTHHANGVFAVEAGSNWNMATEYVNGKMTVLGDGTTIANIGDAAQSTMTITTIAGDSAICDYTNSAPPAGAVTALGNYVISDTEYWTVTNTGPSIDLSMSDLTEESGATYGGVVSEGQETVIVRLDGADWKLYTESTGTGQFALAVDTRVKINPIVFLQGAYVNPASGEETWMRDDLRNAGIIPTTSPYMDGLVCDASVFTPTGSDAIVDWVWVELRDKNDNTSVLGMQSALLQRDGDVVDIDGTSPLRFSSLSADNYFVVITHRNHLGVITANTVALSTIDTILNFSNNNTMQNGGDNAVVEVTAGIYGIYAGDYDGNGQIQSQDVTAVVALVGLSPIYNSGDVDSNTQIQAVDVSIMTSNVGKGQQARQLDLKLNAKIKN